MKIYRNEMRCKSTATYTSPTIAGALVALFLFGCVSQESAEIRIMRLDAAEADRLAREIRDSVSVELADGLELSLWAPEQLIADPVALHVDDLGRVYVTRTQRRRSSALDVRAHRHWMTESLSLRTVEDKRAFLRRVLAPDRSDEQASWLPDRNGDGSHDWRDLAVEKEQIYRLEDTTGDGRADFAQLFVEGFNTEVSEIAGTVLAFGDDVFVGVAPDLWRLRDTSGDGMADVLEPISSGYGVNIGFGGHGMSGLTVGPDGRIYWGIGDMGLHVVDQEGRVWAYPDQGAIMRVNPDGSDFEVFAAGLRNTHEFVFDELGNLISVENDGDHPGEFEGVVYLIDGSDGGWRTNWQFGKYDDPDNNEYKVWMDEGLFRPRFEGQAAHVLPPIAPYHNGPAGMAYEPGTALGEEWRRTFFVAEFTGTPARSAIHAFRLEPEGAGFRLSDSREILRGILAVGLSFGPDGALYFTDWIEGWETNDQGRIWKLDVSDASGAAASSIRTETQALLAADAGSWTPEELFGRLGHPDMRVRMKVQFELVERGREDLLLAAARGNEPLLARLHGIWGVGQLARKGSADVERLAILLEDVHPEVRAQVAKVMGDAGDDRAASALVWLLEDEAPRVRFFATEALGRIGRRDAIGPIVAMLAANDDEDVYLRHAGSVALARIGAAEPLAALADHPSRAVRLAAVVALRRMQHPSVRRFLDDEDEFVVTDASRAIHDDASIAAALPDLASMLDDLRFMNEPLVRRVLSANLRLGGPEEARRVAAFAARADVAADLRVEAVQVLGVWSRPSVLDRVDGWFRGETVRDPAIAREAITPVAEGLLADGNPLVQVHATGTVGRLAFDPAGPALFALLESGEDAEVRLAALEALVAVGYERMGDVARAALEDEEFAVRAAALRLLPALEISVERTVELIASVLDHASLQERQAALVVLGGIEGDPADGLLADQLDRLLAGDLDPRLALEVVEAAELKEALRGRLERYRSTRPNEGLAAYAEALHGGDVEAGRQIFFQNEAAQCARCHVVDGRGSNVGPDLTNVAVRLEREDLLRALVDPNARVAPGFGPVSGMPSMEGIMTRREMRDVVEFLSTLQ